MTAIFTNVLLFVRGREAVRIVRTSVSGTTFQLAIEGPGRNHQTREFPDALSCGQAQSLLERQLVSEGFRSAADRRSGDDRRQYPREHERRRTPG